MEKAAGTQRPFKCRVLAMEGHPLCGVLEDHTHGQKRCFFLQDALAFVKQLWGVYIEGNNWYEPSRMCIDYQLLSVTTVQLWLVWSAVYACWLIRRESLTVPVQDIPTAVL